MKHRTRRFAGILTAVALAVGQLPAVGGIVGVLSGGNIEKCCNTGSPVGPDYVGGIAGVAMSNKDPQTKNIISTASVTLCKNVSSVTAHGGYAGGIAGRINSKNGSVISNCYNRGISIRGNITTYDGQFTPGSIASVLIAPPAWDDPGKHTSTFKIWGEIDGKKTNVIKVKVKYEITCIPGDVNGDGKVNMRDYALLQKYLLRPESVSVVEAAADIDGNGKINMRDYSALQKLLLKSTK